MSYELKIDTQFITMATWFAHRLVTSLDCYFAINSCVHFQ